MTPVYAHVTGEKTEPETQGVSVYPILLIFFILLFAISFYLWRKEKVRRKYETEIRRAKWR